MKKLWSRVALAVALALTLAGSVASPAPAATLNGVSIGVVKKGQPPKVPSYAAYTAFCPISDDRRSWWVNVDQRRWDYYHSSLGGLLDPNGNAMGTVPGLIVWTNPMMVEGNTLAQAASGAFDAQWRQMATTIRNAKGAAYDGVFRPNNEGNGSWMPWKWKKGEEAIQAQAFQRYVTVVRSVLPNARFEWNLQLAWDDTASGYGGQDMALAYPGDAYVNFIGGDIYYRVQQGDPADAQAYWAKIRDHRLGLTWLATFAKAHGKQIALSEWGLDNNSPWYVQTMAAWIAANDVAYEIYWMTNEDPGAITNLMDGTKPAAATAFQVAFCGGPSSPPVVTPPADGWDLGETLAMQAWNRTISTVQVKPGEVREFVYDVKAIGAAVMLGAVTPDHSLQGNTSWIGGTAASASDRSDNGNISSGSLVKASPGLTFGVGKVNFTMNRVANTLTWATGGKSYTLAVPTWASAPTWSPAVSIENGAGSVALVLPAPVVDPPPVVTPPANDNVPKSVEITVTGGGFTWKGTATRP